jgi:hypothetical protein
MADMTTLAAAVNEHRGHLSEKLGEIGMARFRALTAASDSDQWQWAANACVMQMTADSLARTLPALAHTTALLKAAETVGAATRRAAQELGRAGQLAARAARAAQVTARLPTVAELLAREFGSPTPTTDTDTDNTEGQTA